MFFEIIDWIVDSYDRYIGITISMLWVITYAKDNLRRFFKSVFFCDKVFRCCQYRPQSEDRRCLSNIVMCLHGKFCIQIDVEVEAGKTFLWLTNARPILAEKMSVRPWQGAKVRREKFEEF